MSDYGTLQGDIADDLGRGDLTAQIAARIRSAIAFYGNERFWFNEGRATASTAAGQELYPLPEDCIRPERLALAAGDGQEPLTRRANDDLDAIYSGTAARGRPQEWAILTNQIRLRPLPDAVYAMTLTYVRSLGALADPTDSNAWTVEGERLIRARAEWELYRYVLRDDAMAAACKEAELEALASLKRRSGAVLAAGRLAVGREPGR
jgi:hypothetical protein